MSLFPVSRRRLLRCTANASLTIVFAALVGGTQTAAAAGQGEPPMTSSSGLYTVRPEEYARRAIEAHAALRAAFAVEGTPLYRETLNDGAGQPYAYHWPFVQVLVGVLCLAGIPLVGSDFLPEIDRHLEGLRAYWDADAPTPGYDSAVREVGGGDKYYDDNLWAGLAAIQLYRLTGDPEALFGGERIPGAATQVYQFLLTGWDDTDHQRRGGIYWVEQGRGEGMRNHHRGTDTTAPGAALSRHLWELLPDEPKRLDFLAWADRMHRWLDRWLYDSHRSKLYWDKLLNDGRVDPGFWTYNQGTPIGACALAYRITGQRRYLEHAEHVAAMTLEYCWRDDNFFLQPAAFNAIFFRNLLLLYAENGNPEYLRSMRAYADKMWAEYRDPATGLFRSDTPEYRLHDQAAMVQIQACLAWDPRDYRKLA